VLVVVVVVAGVVATQRCRLDARFGHRLALTEMPEANAQLFQTAEFLNQLLAHSEMTKPKVAAAGIQIEVDYSMWVCMCVSVQYAK